MNLFIVIIFLLSFTATLLGKQTIQQNPRVLVVFVLDQCPYYALKQNQNFFLKDGAFSRFLNKGVNYKKALHPYGIPETGSAHASISTGVLPKDHGIPSNHWFTKDGKIVEFTEDPLTKNSVISTSKKFCGRSPDHLKVDTVSDQMNLHNANQAMHKAISVSIKETAAIATAGQKSPAFWFNKEQGGWTTSRHYLPQLPDWVKKFNLACGIREKQSVAWKLCFPRNHDAYNFPFVDDYEHAELKIKLAGNKEIPIDRSLETPYELFLKTPAASEMLLDFATDCLKNNYKRNQHSKLLLWVCISPLDLMGHFYGPDSREYIDFLHHLDKQMKKFMDSVSGWVGKNNIEFILTADHGIQPIQEISKKKGLMHARRIMAPKLSAKVNTAIEKKFKVSKFIENFESTYFTFNHRAVETLQAAETYDLAVALAKKIIRDEPGIKHVWTYDELKATTCSPTSHTQFYKNSLFRGRVGELIVQPEPYCLVTNYPLGCSHNTPYEYDTHVPLAFFSQRKGFKAQTIRKKVFLHQLAPSIAQILDTPCPSSSVAEALPHLLSEGNNEKNNGFNAPVLVPAPYHF